MYRPIETYVINLEKRPERRVHIAEQFKDRTEFKLQFVKAIENENGALGLWLTIKQIVAEQFDTEFILICEDDHQFTSHYDKQKLLDAIEKSRSLGADVLMGGVSWFEDGLQVDEHLFWLYRFNGLQFTVVFSKFFDAILSYDFKKGDTSDKIFYQLSNDKFVMYPFISKQKEFGYSDATPYNNVKGYVYQIFEASDTIFSHLVKVNKFYKEVEKNIR